MKWGIKYQVLLLALVPTITISILLGAYFTSTRLQDLQENFRKRGEAIALKLAPAGEQGVYSHNKEMLQNLCNTALKDLEAQSVAFYTDKGAELASAGLGQFSFNIPEDLDPLENPVIFQDKNEAAAFIIPIIMNKKPHKVEARLETHNKDKLVGWLKVELETKTIKSREYQILFNTGIIFLLGLCISALHAFQMGRNVTRPLSALADAVDKIKAGALNTRVKINTYRELEILASGINTMAQSLESAHTELQNKVDQATLSLRRTLETIEVQNIELEIARRTAEKANKIKSEFLADMSHEIRTPLNGVLGFINLLKKTKLESKQQEYIITIQKSANNLLMIINDILDFSKIEAGKLRMEHTPMDIRECVEETLNLLAPHAQEKSIALIPLIYPDVPHHFLGDPLRIKQIITNLVSNSIKFTEQGSVIVRVILEHENFSSYTLRMSVTDTGIGIDTDEQKTLFQAFNQTKIDTTRKFGGTGLGLVICKKLVEQMGGSIHVESEPSKGATFWFTFQVEKYAEPESVLQELPAETVSVLNEFKTPFNVLAVDDNPENLKLISVLLEDMGMHVTAVNSGEAAIEKVEEHIFHLILMDIRMPTMNGIEAAHVIRELESKHQRTPTPIIALTAHALVSEKKALLAAGIDDYLAKPIGENELKNILNKWIRPESPKKSIDWELGKKLAGGRMELAKEFLEKLLAGLPQDKIQINEDFEQKDWQSLRDHVHKLHGACCYCGVPQLKRSAQQLENVVASRTLDVIKPHLDTLNLEIDLVLAEVSSVVI